MATTIPPIQLQSILNSAERSKLALLDIREYAEYNRSHILEASPLPRRLIEFSLQRRVPNAKTRIILCDEDEKLARLAAQTIGMMGYSNLLLLEGGLKQWIRLNLPIERRMHTSGKIFGEKVLHEQGIPEITAEALHARIVKGEDIMIIDVRTPEEFQGGRIAGAINLPGVELLRLSNLSRDKEIVTHCAGRTRSIIGAATLRRMGFQKAFALKNGTMGWKLAGFKLETAKSRETVNTEFEGANTFADRIAKEDNIQSVNIAEAEQLLKRRREMNVYFIDVRTREEFFEGHIPGFEWMPGGQAIQQAEELIPVQTGKIIFTSNRQVRSTIVASWYQKMGFKDVLVLEGGVKLWASSGLSLDRGEVEDLPFGYEEAKTEVVMLKAQEFNKLRSNGTPIIFVDTSDDFRQSHIPGSHWILRSRLEMKINLPKRLAIGVTCSDGRSAPLAGSTLKTLGYEKVYTLQGGLKAWRNAQLPVESGFTEGEADDVVHIGAEQSREEMADYLNWEQKLAEKYHR